ncbi:hypothetical protein FRC18_009684 [Serendipita sp. 400]|nr:hypothetical protein FRC18_009684 [Serendipita sp. 400]
MPVWLITGASKGIGLGFVQALALDPENAVLATCRTPAEATELQAIATASEDLINVVQLDHEKPESCQQAATEAEDLLGELPIDYIINNAAFVSQFYLSIFVRFSETRFVWPNKFLIS